MNTIGEERHVPQNSMEEVSPTKYTNMNTIIGNERHVPKHSMEEASSTNNAHITDIIVGNERRHVQENPTEEASSTNKCKYIRGICSPEMAHFTLTMAVRRRNIPSRICSFYELYQMHRTTKKQFQYQDTKIMGENVLCSFTASILHFQTIIFKLSMQVCTTQTLAI